MKRKPAASHWTVTDAQNLKRGKSEVNPGRPVSIIMSGNSISEVAEDAELSVVALEAERSKNCGGEEKNHQRIATHSVHLAKGQG